MQKIFYFLVPMIVILIIAPLLGTDGDYERSIENHWKDRHDFFQSSEASPFVQRGIEYEPVAYFPPDDKYKVHGKLERATKREILSVANSDGTTSRYLRFGTLKFKLDGKGLSLVILKALGFGDQYLTAFADETSGVATYGGGRYLDLVIGKSDRVEVDFNKAYNPYCAYFEDCLCPLPPRANLLNIPVEAGEKNYKSE